MSARFTLGQQYALGDATCDDSIAPIPAIRRARSKRLDPRRDTRHQPGSHLRLKEWRSKACNLVRVTHEIDIWRAANLMLKRHGEKALEESAAPTDELAAQDDYWRRRLAPDHRCVGQLANQTPLVRCTDRGKGVNDLILSLWRQSMIEPDQDRLIALRFGTALARAAPSFGKCFSEEMSLRNLPRESL